MTKSNSDFFGRYDNDFYKIMSENFGDEIFVTDGAGIILFINPVSAKDIGSAPEDVIGRFVGDVVEEGMFYPSVTLEVLKNRKPMNIIQTLYDGQKVLCSGIPVFDDDGVIKMVVSTTKKVDEISALFKKLDDKEVELENLRNIALQDSGFISAVNDPYGISNKIAKLAHLDVPVLIQGETGVGKEVAAKAMHILKYGRSRPIIKINCGTIPENLIESELFGYEAGAFTGANREGKKGKIEMAEGGTLFLDEIGEMPLKMQVKLLDFIQDGTFTRVGGIEEKKVNTRIISATNRNLKKMCENGDFRFDLYFRLNVIPLEIPPLRKRPEDLDAFIIYFLSECNSKYNDKKRLNRKALKLIREHDWPGNVRELHHFIEQVYIMSDDKVITGEDIIAASGINGHKDAFGPDSEYKCRVICDGIMPLREAKRDLERQLVLRAYKECGSTYKAAEALHVDQSTVAKLLKKYTETETE
ncbi:MAG: sigma-54 interaction domain-containing protein [Lentihominibacter sp.]|jgi:transcriptional regulator with PAS, ATPase and Fis domain